MFKTTAYAACVHIRKISTKQHAEIKDSREQRQMQISTRKICSDSKHDGYQKKREKKKEEDKNKSG